MTITYEHETERDLGVYEFKDAELFVRATTPHLERLSSLTTRHLRSWVRQGLTSHYLEGVKTAGRAINFLDLISLRMIAVMRAQGMKSRDIQILHSELRREQNWPYPFAMEPIWTTGSDAFVRRDLSKQLNAPEHLPNIGEVSILSPNRLWQIAFDFIDEYMVPIHDVVFGDDLLPKSWKPTDGVLIDPDTMFGDPCIEGTRIPTSLIWSFYKSGDSIERIAKAYQCDNMQIEAAIDWEQRLADNSGS